MVGFGVIDVEPFGSLLFSFDLSSVKCRGLFKCLDMQDIPVISLLVPRD